jgi:hypothetical protein
LVLPFAVALFILRTIVDKILPANAQCDTAADYVGGGICGIMSGIVTAGIMLIGVSFLRVRPDWGGYQPASYSTGSARGTMERNKAMWAPWADRLTANLYTKLSLTTLRTGEPLAKYYPDIVSAAGANRMTFEGKGRTGLKKGAAQLVGWYTIGDERSPFQVPKSFDQLARDTRRDTIQKIADLDGEPILSGAVAGYIVSFTSKAFEGTGQVVVGSGNLRLVCESLEDESFTQVHPIAVISRVQDPTKIHYARFPFDNDDFYVTSVGGQSNPVLGFEFPVPAGYRPLALYVKNYRFDVSGLTTPIGNFADPVARDAVLAGGKMAAMTDVGPIIDPNTGKQVEAGDQTTTFNEEPVRVTTALGYTIQKGTEQGLTLSEKERGGYTIESGEMKLHANRAAGFGQVDRKLQIAEFGITDDTAMVQVDITPRMRREAFRNTFKTIDRKQPVVLVDENGTRYEAVGFLYKESSIRWLRYTRGNPLRNLDEAAKPVTENNPDRELKLIFVVSRGVKVKELKVGDVTLDTFDIDTSTVR